MNPYEILGIAKDASAALIRGAYRNAVKSAHPDAGGSREAFEQVQFAYEILIDPIKRLSYDTTGKVDEPTNDEATILNTVQTAIESLIEKSLEAAEYIDIVAEVKNLFTNGIANMADEISSLGKKIALYERIQKRFKSKTKNNQLARMMQYKIDTTKSVKLKMEHEIVVARKALVFLGDYSFDKQTVPMASTGMQQFGYGIGPLIGRGGFPT